MQSLLRQTATATSRCRPWRGVPLCPGRMPSLRLSRALWCQTRTRIPSSALPSVVPGRRRNSTDAGPQAKKSDRLRILFCGSDDFSCEALERVYGEKLINEDLVESIDVLTRTPKSKGRGLTQLSRPVSFGLFIPPRILQQAKYGGLNVHPSILPDLAGPAPLQHALLHGDAETGVSLQTLDHRHFDKGVVLARTPAIPIPSPCTLPTLLAAVTPVAADLLVRGLRDGAHVPPLVPAAGGGGGRPPRHAPKITKADQRVTPANAADLARRFGALGPLWLYSRARKDGRRRRLIVEAVAHAVRDEDAPATPYRLPYEGGGPDYSYLDVWVPAGNDGPVWIAGCNKVEVVKVESDRARPASRALRDFLVPVGAEKLEGEG
ncbi:formyl transferase [Jackrogersella minutella]|nr:formyl transferase [Jackrogersella minutella]